MGHVKNYSYIIIWATFVCRIDGVRENTSIACPHSCACVLESVSLYTSVKCDLNRVESEDETSLYPFAMPINTSVVELQTVYGQSFFKLMSFKDNSWGQVLELTINASKWRKYSPATNNSLNGLDKLKVLRMHNLIDSIESGVFLNTPHITALDMSNNKGLRLADLIRALRNTSPKLKYLDISYIERAEDTPVIFGPDFTEILETKNIEVLNVSGTKQITFDISYMYTSIRILNISRCSLDWIPRHIGHEWFPNIREIDISYSFYSFPYIIPSNITIHYKNDCKRFLRSLRLLYAHDLRISLLPLPVVDGNFSYSCESLSLEFIDISNCNIRWLNVSTNIIFKYLATAIVSRNSLEYISPKLLYSFPNLRFLRIEHNNLYTMQYFPDFEQLFLNNRALETLDMSWNGLTFLQRKMFIFQQNLKELYLQGNKIVHFDVELKHSLNLRALDLSDNGPVLISSSVTLDLDVIKTVTLHNSTSENASAIHYFYANSTNISSDNIYRVLVVNLRSNIFDCSCKRISFLLWLAGSKIHFEDRTSYKCGEEFYYREVNKDNVLRLDDYCKLQMKLPFIIVPCVIGGLLIICIVLIMQYTHRRGRVNKRRRQYVNDYEEKYENEIVHLQEVRYPAFLSFCSDDNDVAKGYFYPMITKALQAHFGEKEVLALGETIFKPGKLIYHEIEECFSRSDVILFLVTLDFIQSDWCRFELNQADLLGKPTIYLVENTVMKGKLPLCLGKLKTHTRATWTREGNDIKISPDWNLIAEQVLDFAVAAKMKNLQ